MLHAFLGGQGQVLQSSISQKIMVDIIPFGVIHKKVGPFKCGMRIAELKTKNSMKRSVL
jgi:hypothetical protein